MTIKILYHSNSQPRLALAEKGDWIDLYTAYDESFFAGEFRLVSLGISAELPEGYEAYMIPRSSTFIKYGIMQANSIGLIDNSYKGKDDIWFFPAYASRDVFIPAHTRLCQFRIHKKMQGIIIEEAEALESENRGGFGSTGS